MLPHAHGVTEGEKKKGFDFTFFLNRVFASVVRTK